MKFGRKLLAFSNAATYSLFFGDGCAAEYMCAVTVPTTASPMVGSRSSSVTSPGPISLTPALSRPRSVNWRTNVPPWPDGTKMNSASGLASAARCRNGAKSGLASGMRMAVAISPPAALNLSVNDFSPSTPGA
jgi:hypothetical protein